MSVFELIYKDDVVALSCLIAILYIVGGNMADAQPRRWGWRAAAAAYVFFVAYAMATVEPTTAAELAGIAFRGLFAGGLALGPTWIILAIALFLWAGLPNVERSVVVHPPPTPPVKPLPVDYDLLRREQEERERTQREQAERKRRLAHDRAKCDELRLECELLYSKHAEHLYAVLPPERFAALLDSYLSGQSDPLLVQKRTSMIQKMLTDRAAAVEPSTFGSLQALAEHYAALRRESQELPYEDDTRESIVAALNRQEDKAIEVFFERSDQ